MPVLAFKNKTGKAINWCAASLLLIIILIISCGAQQPPAREYQIKSIFLFNFTQFVEWPSEAFGDANEPFVVGVLGEDPFGAYLDETVKDEMIGNHPLIVERYSSVDEIKKCHILFIATKDKQEIRRVLNNVKLKPVLTVSDVDGFTRMGGMIRFLNEGGRIRFRINVGNADEARLTISSKLLRLAEIIHSKN